MRLKSKFVLVFGALGFLWSCTQTADRKELQLYVANPSNGLSIDKSLNGITVRLTYKPSALVALQFASESTLPDSIEALIEYYEQYQYYILSFSNQNGDLLNQYAQNREQFGSLVNELSFNMSQYTYLLTDQQDTLYLLDAVFPRLYSMSQSTDILLVFKNPIPQVEEYYDIKLKDFGFSTGNTNFRFYKKDINNTPHLIVK